MKKLFLSCIIFASAGVFTFTNAQTTQTPAKIVVITKQNVNVRQSPQTNADVVGKASSGTLFEFIAEKGSWYEVKDINTGKIVYISNTVSRLMDGKQVARTDNGIVEADDYTNYVYQKNTRQSNGEIIMTYAFYNKNEKNSVYATYSFTQISQTGNMSTQEAYYKGKQMGWYMLFDEIVDYEGVVQEKMEEPLIVYSNGAQGVTINGQKYNKVKNEF